MVFSYVEWLLRIRPIVSCGDVKFQVLPMLYLPECLACAYSRSSFVCLLTTRVLNLPDICMWRRTIMHSAHFCSPVSGCKPADFPAVEWRTHRTTVEWRNHVMEWRTHKTYQSNGETTAGNEGEVMIMENRTIKIKLMNDDAINNHLVNMLTYYVSEWALVLCVMLRLTFS